MMKRFMPIFVLLLVSPVLMAGNPEELVERAGKAYADGNYSHAVALYEQVLAMGYDAPELYYNLGNAYYREGRYAPAILNYERGLRLRPSDPDLLHNLGLAREQIQDRFQPVPELFFVRWWRQVLHLFSTDGWARLGLACLVLFLACLLWYLYAPDRRMRQWAFFLALMLAGLTTLSLISARQQYRILTESREAILFAPRATAKSAPGMDSPDLFVIHEGVKVLVTDEVGDWAEVRLPNNLVGWIRKEHLERI